MRSMNFWSEYSKTCKNMQNKNYTTYFRTMQIVNYIYILVYFPKLCLDNSAN